MNAPGRGYRALRWFLSIIVLVGLGGPGASVRAQGARAVSRGSGTIEATIVQIQSVTPGRVALVAAEAGDEVQADDELIRLDLSDLQAQEGQALAAVELARANLDRVTAPPRAEVVAVAEAEVARAEAVRDGARAVWTAAAGMAAAPDDLDRQVEAAAGRVALLTAQQEGAQAALHEAEVRRNEAERRQFNDQEATQFQVAVKQALAAEANLAAVTAELEGAQNQLALVQAVWAEPVALLVAADRAEGLYRQGEAAMAVAEAGLAAKRAQARPEEAAVARAELRAAEAALSRVWVQMGQLVIRAPRGGVILSRMVEPGEVTAAGAPLMTLADLESVTLRVFISEAEIGGVRVGQTASVRVDALPGEVLAGTVEYIADEAEFIPKDIQTTEGRARLVFAVRIRLENPDRQLKAGMTAEAEFTPQR